MKNIMTILLLSMTAMITGCANGVPSMAGSLHEDIVQSNEKIFVGVPVLLSAEGSAVRLDDEWMITAAHNKFILEIKSEDVYYHPTCDVALYRKEGVSYTDVSKVYSGESINHVGYPIGMPLSQGRGEYSGDILVEGWDDCTYSATTGTVMAGMSGGGVYNSYGELVGINHGFNSSKVTWPDGSEVDSPAVFVSLVAVSDWLASITGKEYF